MDQRTDILADPWHCGFTNRQAIKAIFMIDCSLFIISVVLFIRNAILASGALSFIIIDFLMLSTSSFQCILGGMTLKKMRLNQNVLFLRHYVNMKIIHLIFFGTEYGVYVPIVCKDPDFGSQQEHICTYMGLGLPTYIVWFLLQLFLLTLVGRIFLRSNRDPRFQQRRILLNIYQQPAVEVSNQQAPQNEPMGVTVECEGIPFSLVNSGPMPFKIFESLPLQRKIILKKHQEKKQKNQDIEEIDIRYLVISSTQAAQQKVEPKVHTQQVPNKRRFEDHSDTNVVIQITGNPEVGENALTRNKSANQMFNLRKLEDYKITTSLTPDEILTRNK